MKINKKYALNSKQYINAKELSNMMIYIISEQEFAVLNIKYFYELFEVSVGVINKIDFIQKQKRQRHGLMKM